MVLRRRRLLPPPHGALHKKPLSCVDGPRGAREKGGWASRFGCGHVSGLYARHAWPLALMRSADRLPSSFRRARSSMTLRAGPIPGATDRCSSQSIALAFGCLVVVCLAAGGQPAGAVAVRSEER